VTRHFCYCIQTEWLEYSRNNGWIIVTRPRRLVIIKSIKVFQPFLNPACWNLEYKAYTTDISCDALNSIRIIQKMQAFYLMASIDRNVWNSSIPIPTKLYDCIESSSFLSFLYGVETWSPTRQFARNACHRVQNRQVYRCNQCEWRKTKKNEKEKETLLWQTGYSSLCFGHWLIQQLVLPWYSGLALGSNSPSSLLLNNVWL